MAKKLLLSIFSVILLLLVSLVYAEECTTCPLTIDITSPLEGYTYASQEVLIQALTNNPASCEFSIDGSEFVNMGYNGNKVLGLDIPLNSEKKELTEYYLNMLARSSITPSGLVESKTYQKILPPSAKILFNENLNDYFLTFYQNEPAYEYEISFSPALKSRIDKNRRLYSIENKKINLLGKEYTIVTAEHPALHDIKIKLATSAVHDILEEGQTKTYTFGGKDYEVTVSYIGTSNVKFTVNGEVSDSLASGGTYKFSDGTEICVINVLAQNLAGEVDKVEFYFAAEIVELHDTNTTNDLYDGTTNNDEIKIDIKTELDEGTDYGCVVSIKSIKAKYAPTENIYVAEGSSLGETAEDSIFLNAFDINLYKFNEDDSLVCLGNGEYNGNYVEGDSYCFKNINRRQHEADKEVSYGEHELTVVCREEEGNIEGETLIFYVAPDSTPPEIIINFPQNNSVITEDLLLNSSVSFKGESWKVETSTKKLELSEGSAVKETISNITSFIDATDLNILAEGSITPTGKNEARYDQYLHFNNKDSGYVFYTEDNNDVTADFLYFPINKEIAEYEMQFKTNLESDITGTNLEDFVNKKLTIMGIEYTITSAKRMAEKHVKLTLMGEAVDGLLSENEEEIYKIDEKDYQVTLSDVGTSYAKFIINEETSSYLAEGETYTFSDGIEINIIDITAGEVLFTLGNNKLVLEDEDIESRGIGEQNLEVNGEDMDYARVMITGWDDGSTVKISNIYVNITAEDDLYVPAGGKLSELLDEPGALVTNNWDIEYKGLSEAATSNIKIRAPANTRYELEFTDADGNTAKLPLVYADAVSRVRAGDNNYNLSINESLPIERNDYFFVTDETLSAGQMNTWALQYKGADASSTSNPEIKFKNLATGETITRSYTEATGGTADAEIRLGGQTFNVVNATASTTANFQIYVDMDGDGELDNTIASINTHSGAKIEFAYDQAQADELDKQIITISTPNPDDYDTLIPSDMVYEITADSNTLVQVSRVSGPVLITPAQEDHVEYGYTSLGAFIKREYPTSAPSELTIAYPKIQRLPQVYITEKGATKIEEKKIKLEIETDEKAFCEFYGSICPANEPQPVECEEIVATDLSTNNGLSHYAYLDKVKDGSVYDIIINCEDNYGNSNTETVTFYVNLTKEDCTTPTDGMVITEDITFCRGTYNFPHGRSITMGTDNVTLDCNGAVLNGNYSGIEPSLNNGIYADKRKNVGIMNCNIRNYAQGIRLVRTTDSRIVNNNLDNNVYGMYVLENSDNNLISNNNIINSSQRGINVDGSDNNYLISNNVLNSNWEGIFIGALSYYNYVYNNNISNNCYGIPNRGGIYSSVSDNNMIFHNNIISNNIQAGGSGKNLWDNGILEGGNYWSDYDEESEGCYDTNSDRICDSPYIIDIDNQDNYPFKEINGWLNYSGCTTPTDGMVITEDTTFCQGTYNLPNGIEITADNVVLDCSGAVLEGNGVGWGDYGIYLDHKSDITIKNCNVSEFGYGIYLDYSSNNNLSDNIVNNNNEYGFFLRYDSNNNVLSGNTAYNNYKGIIIGGKSNTLSGNTVYNNDFTGIGLVGNNANNNVLSSNIIYNTNEYGILLLESFNNTLFNNTAYNNSMGIRLTESSNNNVLFNNIVYNNSEHGIMLHQSSNNSVYGNMAKDNNLYGIYLEFSNSNKLINNSAKNNSRNGIYLYSSNNNDLAENILSFNGKVSPIIQYAGIYLSYSHNNKIVNNDAVNNDDNGLTLWYSHDNHVANNNFENNDYYGIQVRYSDYNSITNNTIKNNRNSGVQTGSLSDHTLVQNNIIEGSSWGINLFKQNGSITIIENQIINNEAGIILSTFSDNLSIKYNNIYNNTNFNFQNNQPQNISAENNYWGTTDTTEIQNKIYDFYDDNVGIVDFCPYLDAPFPLGNSIPCEEDTTPPSITIINPINNSTITTDSTWLNVTTDEDATCYSNLDRPTYEYSYEFIRMNITGEKSHLQNITSLEEGNDYILYVNCGDYSNNSNTETVSFNVNFSKADLTVTDIIFNPNPKVGGSLQIDATIENLGDVATAFWVEFEATNPNGSVFSGAFPADPTNLIESLEVINISLSSFGPLIEGIYNVTVTVQSEEPDSDLSNNQRTEAVYVSEESCTTPTDGMVITEDTTFCQGTYNLPNGIEIGADNVVLDCDGATINGSTIDKEIYGIMVRSNNITIKNCNIQNFWYGVGTISAMGDCIYEYNNITKTKRGIILDGGPNNIISFNNFFNNIDGHIVIGGLAPNTFITNNNFYGSGTGLYINHAIRNTISNNTFDGCEDSILLYNSANYNYINNNNITNSTGTAIKLQLSANYNDITRNFLKGNYMGLDLNKNGLEPSYNNTIWDNDIYDINNNWFVEGGNLYCVNGVGNNYYDGANGPKCPVNFSTIASTIESFLADSNSFYFVVGDNYSAEDVVATVDIADTFRYYSDENCSGGVFKREMNPTMLASQINDTYNTNLVSIGRPQNNEITNIFLPSSLWPIGENTAIISVFEHNNTAVLLIAGNEDLDTRKASAVIADYEDYNLDRNCFEINTTSLELGECDFSKYPVKDTTPPNINIINPINNSTITENSVWLNVTTDEDAVCKYNLCKSSTWHGGGGGGCSIEKNRSITDGTYHSQLITGLHNTINNETQNEHYSINVNCKDNSGNSNKKSVTFYVNLAEENHPPEIVSVSDVPSGVEAGDVIEFSISAKDSDDNSLNFRWYVDGVLVYEEEVEEITEEPAEGIEPEPIEEVSEEYSKPIIENFENITVNEGDTIELEPIVVDPEGGLVILEYTGWMTSSTKIMDFDDAGIYQVTLTVTSTKTGEKTVKTITITVLDVNRPPVIIDITPQSAGSSGGGGPIPIIEEPEEETEDVIHHSSFIYHADEIGEHEIKVVVSDGEFETEHIWEIDVKEVNHPPTFNPIPDITWEEDTTHSSLNLNDYFTDIDGDTLDYGYETEEIILGEPNQPGIGVEITNGQVTLTPEENWFGTQIITFEAKDGEFTVESNDITLTVTNVNDAPAIELLIPPSANIIKITEDGSQTFDVSVSDTDSTPSIQWFVNNASIDGATNNYYTFTAAGAGTYDIKVEISDENYTISQSWNLAAFDKPVANLFDGETTNFSSIDLKNATNVIIEKASLGRIDFRDVLNLEDVIDIDSNIIIEKAKITINTDVYPQLNKPATLKMHGLSFNNPLIFMSDDSYSGICPDTVCTNINYTDGKLIFDVAHFTTYYAEDEYISLSTPSKVSINAERDRTITKEFTITNNGNIPLQIVNITTGISSGYNPLVSFTGAELGAGRSKTISIKLDIPETEDSGVNSIGKVYIDTDKLDKEIPVGLIVDSGLSITVKSNLNAEPGEKLGVEVKVDSNINLDDVEVEGILYDIDDGDNIEDQTSSFDLDSRSRTKTLEFDIPLILDDEEYMLELTAEGEDENNALHSAKITVYVNIKKSRHEVIISKADISQTCEESSLKVELINIGKEDEELTLQISNSADKLTEKSLELEAGSYKSKYSNTFTFEPIAGDITINVFDDKGSLMYQKILAAIEKDCPVVRRKQTTEPAKSAIVVNSEVSNQAYPREFSINPIIETKSFRESSSYTTLLIIVLILLTGAVIYGCMYLVMKKKQY